MKKKNDVVLSVRVTAEMLKALKRLSEQHALSLTTYVRMLIKRGIDQDSAKKIKK
jgi:predicted DNA-binding protein